LLKVALSTNKNQSDSWIAFRYWSGTRKYGKNTSALEISFWVFFFCRLTWLYTWRKFSRKILQKQKIFWFIHPNTWRN
jgi:hypothetical protein